MNAAALIPVLAMAALAVLLGPDAYAQAPPPPIITSPAHNDVIHSNTVTISGTSVQGYLIVILDSGNAPLGSTLVTSPAGDWSVDIPMSDGARIILAAAFPDLGDTSTYATSNPLVITVSGGSSTVDSNMPVITSPASGTIVTSSSVTLHGTALPNSIIRISDASRTTLATERADDGGNWQAEVSLPDGMHSPVAVSFDLRSGGFLRSVPITVYVTGGDPADPATPIVTYPASGATIPSNTFEALGTAEPGAGIAIIDLLGNLVGYAVADETGAWSAEVTDVDGAHYYSAIAGKDGSRSYHSDPFLVFVGAGEDRPGELPLPTITSPTPGALITGGNDVLISGTAAPNALVEVLDLYRVPLGVTYADGSGDWSVTIRLVDGLHTLVAIYYAADGATSGHSAFSIVHVDSGATALDRPVITSPPTESVHDSSRAATISGTAAPNSEIKIINYYDAEIGTAESDGAGAWSATIPLPKGLYLISAIASTDSATTSSNSEVVMLFVNDLAPSARVCR